MSQSKDSPYLFVILVPDRKRKGASPAKHCTPIARPSSNLIHCKESQPWAAAKSSRNLLKKEEKYYTKIICKQKRDLPQMKLPN